MMKASQSLFPSIPQSNPFETDDDGGGDDDHHNDGDDDDSNYFLRMFYASAS